MGSKRVSNENWCREVCGHLFYDFLLIRRLLEHQVMVLDGRVYEDCVELGEIGQDTLDLALHILQLRQIPLT